MQRTQEFRWWTSKGRMRSLLRSPRGLTSMTASRGCFPTTPRQHQKKWSEHNCVYNQIALNDPYMIGPVCNIRLVDQLPNVVSISEVDFITYPMVEHVKHEIEPAELTFRPYNTEAMATDLLWSGLIIQSKNLRGRKVFIKPRSSSLANLGLITSSRSVH